MDLYPKPPSGAALPDNNYPSDFATDADIAAVIAEVVIVDGALTAHEAVKGSTSAFGHVEVDGVTITAAAGVISAVAADVNSIFTQIYMGVS